MNRFPPTARPARAAPAVRATRRLRRAALLLCLALSPLAPRAAPAAPPPLTRLALSLADQPDPLRADLAYAALTELAAAYALEAERARADTRGGARDLRRWANAVDKMADEFAALAAGIDSMTQVEVRAGPDNGLYLIVAGKPVLVSGPRPREQAALERRVIARYCELNLCDPELVVPAAERAQATAPGRTRSAPVWSFSQAGPICETADGLEFQFSELVDLGHKRELCAAVVAELQLLADELTRGIAGGMRVDWNALAIADQGEVALHRVRVNTVGADLLLPLPALAARPELFALIRPWLAAKVKGERYHLVVINAGQHLNGQLELE